jgi:hypothetical protein
LDGGAEREISEAGSRPQQVASLKLSLSAPPSKPVRRSTIEVYRLSGTKIYRASRKEVVQEFLKIQVF